MDISGVFQVDGMVAVVTGGDSGIGPMMTKALAGAGEKKVYILGRRKAVLERAAAAHSNLSPLEWDVTSKESFQVAVDAIPYDPSLAIRDLHQKLFDDAAMTDFTQTFDFNVTGVYFTMLAFLKPLDAGNGNALVWGGEGVGLARPRRRAATSP
ncbi:hypothetical protein DL769_003794 [Monosporascus sp. CRB-8-3]|nr:hypothetical protein DL769_003794 [Monosporascus sp. CRB-8-3]